MNKLFTKIAGLSLGLAMAIGVGVAVGSNSKDAKSASAAAAGSSIYQSGQPSWGTTYSYGAKTLNSVAWYVTTYGNNNCIGWNKASQDKSSSADFGPLTKSNSSYGMYQTANDFSNAQKITVSVTNTDAQAGNYSIYYSTNAGSTWTTAVTAAATTTKGNSWTMTYDHGSKIGNSVRFAFGISGNTNATGTRLGITQIEVWQAASKTLSSISLGGSYTTEFTVGDTFNHTGMTVTAHYSDSTTANVTSSATWSSPDMSSAGSKTVTVSYTEGTTKTETYSITVSAPSTPFITPAKNSTSGYTGTNESLSFTYGNLTGSLSVASSNTSVVTVGTPSTSAGSGTVQINFVGAGSTTIKFKDGATERASVSVSVSDPTVTITGMPSARSIATGATLNLGSLITVTPTGNLSSDVTWSSSNSSFASVTQSGVVTGEAVGSATITVTPDDYPAGAVSCTVTVANVMTAVFGTTGSSSSTEVTDGSKYKTDYSYIIDTNITLSDISKVYPQTSNALKFGSSSVVGSMTFSIPSTIDSKPVYITSVTVRAVRYHETKGTTMLIGGVEKELTYSADDYTADLSSGEVTSFVLTADSSSSDKRMYVQSVSIQYAFKKTLSSIALSGSYQTIFTKGGTFNHDGLVVTATYSDSSTADVTSSATFSGYNLSNVGNQTVTVSYTEGTTKTATYSITVNYAAVTSVTLNENTAEIGLGELFNYNLVTVTVSPSNANPAVTWSVDSNTVGDDYVFDASGLKAGDTDGTITLKCESDADSSKYATLVVTVTGDPTAAFVKDSTSGYAGKSEEIAFTYGNIEDESKITVASSNTSIVSVANDLVADEGEGLVTINFVAAGSANVTISYNGGSTLATLPVTVSADSVVSVSWNASNFDVFSGTTLTSEIDNTWLASYEKASGDEGLLEYGDYTLKLGGSAITLPHTWVAADSGKTLCIEYGGVSSSTVSVTVTQTINAVYAPNTDTNTVSWTATAAADLGSQISSQGGTDEGTISTGDYEWDYTRTLVSLASNKSDYIAFQGSTWIQLGSGNALESLEFTTSAIPGTIKSVSVVAATAGTHALTIDVGGTKYLEDESLHVYSGTAAAANPDHADCVKTGTGSSSGTITITIAQSGSTKKAMVIRSISVTYEAEGSGTTNIANNASHKAAQRAAVAYAQAFNAEMDKTKNCTEGLDDAWSACSSAYTAFKSAAAALGETEEAWALNLVKYATDAWSDDSAEACLERMMKTYEVCVQKHGKTAFMSDLVSLGAPRVNPLQASAKSTGTVIAIVIISTVSLVAVGGYFLFRKKKEN